MKKIKILYTINFVTNGGPSRVLLNQIYNLDKKIFDISLMTIIDENDTEIISDLKSYGIKVYELKVPKNIVGAIIKRSEIINTVININPNIIHSHGIVTSIILSSKKIKCKRVTTIHNNIYEDYKSTYGKIKGNFIARVHLNSLKKFDYIFCCSKTSYDVIKNKFYNITYIRNGVDVPHFKQEKKDKIRNKIRKKLNIPKEAIIYCYCGVLNRRKRVRELVEMFNDTLKENEYFILIGDGAEYNDIKSIIKNKNILMLGFKKNVYDYFISSDIYTSNSSSEGFSISIIEALSCNLLLLLSNISSHRECFEIDKKQYIGEIYDSSNFDRKKLIVSQFLKRNKMTNEFYKRNLSGKVMTKRYEKYYKELVNSEKNQC